MNKLVKRLLTGTLALATILTALPVTAVHASGNQYWTESAERVGYIEHVMNDGSIKSTFHEGHMKVEGETAYCVDINTNFKNGYKTRSDASTRMSSDQIADVALSLEYVKQYTATHTGLNNNQKNFKYLNYKVLKIYSYDNSLKSGHQNVKSIVCKVQLQTIGFFHYCVTSKFTIKK